MILNHNHIFKISFILLLLQQRVLLTNAQCITPTNGCINGLWSTTLCKCQCIPPFCLDSNGECKSNTGNCGGNPFSTCQSDDSCPWWIDSSRLERCKSGNRVPLGIWEIYSSKEVCCNVEHPYSTSCNTSSQSDSTSQQQATTEDDDDIYEVIPIKFTLNNLPSDVDIRKLKEEMTTILKRILVDLQDRVQGLKVSNVQENLVLNVNSSDQQGSASSGTVSRDVYFDVTVVKSQQQERWGPVIIAGIKDSYDIILDRIRQWTDEEYFGYNIGFNMCTENNGSFGMCTSKDERVPAKFRLSNVPIDYGLDMSDLIQQVVSIYRNLLKEEVEIINIEVSNEINLSSSDEREEDTVTKDVFLDIIIKPQPGISDFSPVVNNKLSTSRNEILDGIQSHTDSIYTDYNIDWCIDNDNENAYNAGGCRYSFSSTTLLLPIWSIITIAVGSLIACILCCYIIRCSKRRRSDLKNDMNLVSYIDSGKLASKTEQQMAVGQQRSTRRPSQAPLPPPRRRTIDYDNRPRSRSRRRTIDTYDDDRPKISRAQSKRSSRSRSHRMLQQQDDLPRKQDTDYYLENGESFVFDGVEKVDPPQVLAITNGGDEVVDDLTEKPDPDGDLGMMLEGKWFVDEEDIAPPNRR